MTAQIENPAALPLSAPARAVLEHAFAACRRVIVKAVLGGGFSGAQSLLVHPVRETPELPAVVKIAPRGLVEREYRAYQEHICDKLPGAAEIRRPPILLPDGEWAGLCYHLVGGGVFEIESLEEFYPHATPDEVRYIFERRLLKRLSLLWRFSRAAPQFDIRASYDPLLPVNLLLTPAPPAVGRPFQAADGFRVGDLVRLEGFTVTEVDAAQHALTLNLPDASYRVRFRPIDVQPYRVGDVVDAIAGRVTAARADLLRACAQQATGLPLDGARLSPPDAPALDLPNPLLAWPALLNESRDVRIASIHGDLNPANILIDLDARDVCLVDFALTRCDHVLHDLLRLETGVTTRLMPAEMEAAGLPAAAVCELYRRLHAGESPPTLRKACAALTAIREAARGCLLAPEGWDEYYQGLTLYLLGALKFQNLTAFAKQIAFWGAAMALRLRESRSTPRPARLRSLPSPFVAGPPIAHPSQFFGRERELRRLFNLWKRAPLQNAAVVGPRRSGKTSLLLHLSRINITPAAELRPGQRNDWLPAPERYRWVFVDFQDARMGRPESLLGCLLAGMGLAAQPAPCDLERFMETVSRDLHAPTIVLLDEIGVALERCPALDNAFWESLRSLATHQTRGNLAFVLASHEPPEAWARRGGIGSPFFNIFGYTAHLGPLTEAEARELIASAPAPFPPTDVEWILAQSGRWPMLLQILCRECLLALEEADDGAGVDWREEALRQLAPFSRLLESTLCAE